MLAGCFVQLVGVCGFVTYLTLAIVNKQGEQLDNLRKNVLCQSVKLKISKDTFYFIYMQVIQQSFVHLVYLINNYV